MVTNAFAFESLPNDTLIIIIEKLETKDMLTLYQVNRKFATLIRERYLFNDPNVFKKLIRKNYPYLFDQYIRYAGICPSIEDNLAIRLASYYGHAEMVRSLLRGDLLYCDVDPTAKDNEALRKACYYGHIEVVKILLSHGTDDARACQVNPSASNNQAIRWASSRGHKEVVELLLALNTHDCIRVDPSALGNQALTMANYFGHSEVVELLLAEPAVQVMCDA